MDNKLIDNLIQSALSSRTTKQPAAPPPPSSCVLVVSDKTGKQLLRDAKTAALFLLIHDQTHLLDFVAWAMAERLKLISAPTAIPRDESWKWSLLQDTSIDLGSPLSNSRSTTFPNDNIPPADPSPFVRIATYESAAWPNPPRAKRLRASSVPKSAVNGLPGLVPQQPRRYEEENLQVSNILISPTKRQSTKNDQQKGYRCSTRRVPELEGVTVCPDCNRKGQSIFDPNNSNADGIVWQYFYCRNNECPRGRSTARYIGWTTRTTAT